MLDSIKSKIDNIIDKDSYTGNNIIYSYSFIDNKKELVVLHIYNPYSEELIINKQNEDFFTKVCNMLFVKDKNNKYLGCFNHQRDDDDILYDKNTTISMILNNFLRIEYTFILIDTKNFAPLSLFCLIDNYMYDVCTAYRKRGKGYMTKLLIHFFILVKNNKLKKGPFDKIILDIVNINPNKDKVREYYEQNFDFEITKKEEDKIIMSKKI